ncbi:MAG: hybrid sensor histidine kinase/response regulator, partial [Deltaproteobacteria bacterium]|nr:hybrid sensor histidine kinase/response regulator [Deltaproteobacteria bacterium]
EQSLTTALNVVRSPTGRYSTSVSDAVEALMRLADEGEEQGLVIAAELAALTPGAIAANNWDSFIDQPEVPVLQSNRDDRASREEMILASSVEERSEVVPEEPPVSVSEELPVSVPEAPTPIPVVVLPPREVAPPAAPAPSFGAPAQSLVAPELMEAIRAAFRGEADEHLEVLETGLLALEKAETADERASVLERTFRAAHSLKGAARAVGLTEVQSVCQAVEHVFAGLKQGEIRLASDGFDTMHRALDTINALLTGALTADDLVDETIDGLRALVESAQEPITLTAPPIEEPSAPTPPVSESIPVDVRPRIVAVDAPQGSAPQVAAPRRGPRVVEEPVLRATGETIRVTTAKLDSLLLQAEEMLTVRQAAGERTVELRAVLGSLIDWRKEWNKISAQARKLQRIYEGTSEQDRQAQPYLPLANKLLEFLYWNESHFNSLEGTLKNVTRSAERDHRQAGTLIGRLLDDTKKVLMLPFASLLNSFPKMVRDLSRALNKDVEVVMQGAEVEIDKRILDAVKDPLIHLLRNCVDHGIESPGERTRKGKDARGTVSINVLQIGVSKVEILVSDDGTGINHAAVVAAAVKKGILSEQEARALDEQAATALIFQSAVSTSATVTELSGRGLGMAIVREKVERLGGQVWVETTAGHGTTFRILLPLTLATFRGFFVESGGEMFVIPTVNVERVVRIRPAEIKVIEGVETIMLNGRPLGVARLHKVLDIPALEHQDTDTATGFLRGLVLTSGDRRVLFCVDQIANEQEALFKSLGTYLEAVPHVAGVTVLGSGKVVPIIDVPNLVRTAIEGSAGQSTTRAEVVIRPMGKRAVLLVEDSVTSRMLLKGILESAGYEVTTAIDGLDALGQLGRRSFDLVVSDVEMPRMNGFELTTQLRTQDKHLHLPVVLVTGLESPRDRARGMEAGASAYIVKGDFTQNDLLTTVQRFIPAMAA